MAVPISFEPRPHDPREGLRRRLEAAPLEHAEALLVGYDLIQAAHDQGVLDLLVGMVSKKDAIAEELAEGARKQESVDALRNVISLGRMLAAVEPETLSCMADAFARASKPGREEPATLWQLFKRVGSREGRRGLTIVVEMLAALGTRRFADSSSLERPEPMRKR